MVSPSEALLGDKSTSKSLNIDFLCWPAYSHYGALRGLAQELVKKGHKVTVHMPDHCRAWIEKDGEVTKGKAVQFVGTGKFFTMEDWKDENIKGAKKGAFAGLLDVIYRWRDFRDHLLTHLIPLWEKPQDRPDIVVMDVLAYAGYDLEEKYSIKVLVNIPGVYPRALQNKFWLPPISSGMPIDMNLGQRVGVAVRHAMFQLLFNRNFAKEMNKVRLKWGLPPVAPNLSFLDCYPSLMNVNFGVDHAHPVSPMQHWVGPMRDLDCYSRLPEELRQWLDGTAERGEGEGVDKYSNPHKPLPVVYVCMGTVTGQTEEQLKVFCQGLASDSFRVLWSLRQDLQDSLPPRHSIPSNIRFETFVDQVAVLAHPNVKGFLTHGGMASLMEAVHHAKPLVVVPFIADQMDNAARAEDKGFGIRLNRAKMTRETVHASVCRIISDPSYAAAARRAGVIMKSGGGAPRAAEIVEHIAEVGCEHLRAHVLGLPAYKRWNFDVYGVFLLVLLLLYQAITALLY